MTSSILKNNQSAEGLRKHSEDDYYRYLSSPEFCETFLEPMGRKINTIDKKTGSPIIKSVLDVGCGEGQLSQFIHPSISYTGIDASEGAIRKAEKKYPSRNFLVRRLEEPFPGIVEFDAIVFGGIMEVLVAPEHRVQLAVDYFKRFRSTWLIIYDLERLNTEPFKEQFDLIDEHHATVDMPDLIPQKRNRKILILRREFK